MESPLTKLRKNSRENQATHPAVQVGTPSSGRTETIATLGVGRSAGALWGPIMVRTTKREVGDTWGTDDLFRGAQRHGIGQTGR